MSTFRSLVLPALAVAGCLPWAAVASVEASPAEPVRVRFSAQVQSLTTAWAGGSASVTQAVEAGLAARLSERLRHWAFAPAGPTAPDPRPELHLKVTSPVPPALVFSIQLELPGLSPPPSLSERWLSQSDLMIAGYPAAATAAQEILRAVEQKILTKHELQLRSWLSQHVPIGVGAHWLGGEGPPRLVLGLPWSGYASLGQSVFRLGCEWPNNGFAVLDSTGPGISAPFVPPPPDPPFDGVVVVPQEREFAGQRRPVDQIRSDELFQLKPRLVFLREYRPTMDWSIGGGR